MVYFLHVNIYLIFQLGNTLVFLLYLMAKNKQCQEKLYEEIWRLAPNGASLDSATLRNAHYLRACIMEAFRFVSLMYIYNIHLCFCSWDLRGTFACSWLLYKQCCTASHFVRLNKCFSASSKFNFVFYTSCNV